MRHRSSNQIDGYLFETRFPEPPGNHTSLVLPWDEVKLESTLGMVRAEVDLLENLMAYRAIGKQRHTRVGSGVSYPELELDGSYILPLKIDDLDAEIFSTQGGLRGPVATGSVDQPDRIDRKDNWARAEMKSLAEVARSR